jgi:formylglycine-generating enzyme required for sulfatase activity
MKLLLATRGGEKKKAFGILFLAVLLLSLSACVTAPGNAKSHATALIEMKKIPAKSFPLFMKNPNAGPPPMFQTVNSFYMGIYEVTQSQFESVMAYNNSKNMGPNRPKDRASWYEAIVFCNLLSMKEGLNPAYSLNGSTNPAKWGKLPSDTGKGQWDETSGDYHEWDKVKCDWESNGYRLPTDMEWRSAAMGSFPGPADSSYRFAGDPSPGSAESQIDLYGWYKENSSGSTHDVGQKKPNEYGLYDMAGNVWEWVWDWATGNGYHLADEINYRGPTSGNGDKIRVGGSYAYNPYFAGNGGHRPYYQELDAGFRVARTKM